MNRYIKAMEIGMAHENIGITYNNLIDKIQKDSGKMTIYAESTFYYWFVENFSATNIEAKLYTGWKTSFQYYYYFKHGITKPKGNLTESGESLYRQLDSLKWFLNGEASKQYVDYLELQESRQTAQDAREASREANEKAAKSIRLAIWAIIVSAAVGIFSVIIDLAAFSKSPVPPYDVKVIEDKSRAEQLERENGELKDELYKAEMMLEAYESDSVNSGT
ncbi:hypothetical protein F8C76_10185 [Flagellimonas olearia]|uniref:Uncharacterized protein n=1 Tax=Flagellimonas olearia TaxID=552546 RepID=A0A6I1DTY0_9FLAO|nr:hypothetical protein [Allomuricauda olearia]KAB7528230.1 hypothetical protein F8C76_10185 [Allomuricauda olearia]